MHINIYNLGSPRRLTTQSLPSSAFESKSKSGQLT